MVSDLNTQRVRALLAQPRVAHRLEGLALAEQTGAALDAVRPLLQDDSPYVFLHGDAPMVAEVRSRALVVLEVLTRLAGQPPDFGVVQVRRAMPAEQALQGAADACRGLAPREAAALRARVDRFLDERVQPDPPDRPALCAYRTLQLLGRVRYHEEVVDPRTYLTPLQQEIHASQIASPRPRPHLVVRDRSGLPLGTIYRAPGASRWSLDFGELAAAEDARRFAQTIFGIEPGGVPRVRHDRDGAPLTAPDGSLLLDGTIPSGTEDPTALLRSLGAFLARRYSVELVP